MDYIKRDINDHIFMINQSFNLKNNYIESIKPTYTDEYLGFLNYANCNHNNRIVFGSSNFDLLYKEYIKRLQTASKIISECAQNELEIVICTLEYIRFMVTYEFVCADGDEEKDNIRNSAHTFAGSGLNSAITGRGICQSQASFCRDILNGLGIQSSFLTLSSPNVGSHADVLIEGQGVIDPTNYTGTINSIAGGHLYNKYNLQKYSDFSFIDPITFEKCKTKIQTALIKYLGIDKISDYIELNNYDDISKQFIIWILIAKNITPMDKPINSYTISIKNNEVEISSLLELFYIANNLPIKRKYTTPGKFLHENYVIYETILNNNNVCIIPRHNIFMGKNMRGSINPVVYSSDLSSYSSYAGEVLKAKEILKSLNVNFNELIPNHSNKTMT